MPLRLLIIEDSEDDAMLLLRELRKGGIDPDFARVDTPQELEAALAGATWDAVIADYNMPAFSGLDALQIIRAKGLDLPFILVSGVIGEEQAAQAMKAGAHDYIMKGNYSRLVPALERELQDAEVRLEQRQAEEELAEYREHLEEMVRQRTDQLTRANEVMRTEIAERERVEEALLEIRQQSEFLANIVELSSQPLGVGYPDGRLGFVNKAFEQLTGYGADEVSSISWATTLTSPEWREFERNKLEELHRTGRPVRYENEYVRKDGTRVPVELLVHLVTDADGKPEYYYAFLTDITLRRQAEESLFKAKEAAEAANRAKSRFLANMSHELRTPMTGLLGMLEIALGGPLDPQQRECIGIAYRSGRSLLRILNDILDLTKIEAGMLAVEEKPFPLRECVNGALDILIPEARRKGLDLTFAAADDLPRTVIGDQVRLRQVLTILIGNAVKFTERGKVEVRVAAGEKTAAGRRKISFIIADTGIGIPVDKQHVIFSSFSQVDDSHTRSYGGAGLGLTISSELVERMGGTITFASEEGVGSTFSFTVPLGEAVTANVAEPSPETAPAAASAAPLPVSGVKPRLLLAEDDPITRKVIGMMLQRSNYDLDIAEDGLKAVEMWEKGEYDLILMDMQMPRMDGFEATRDIREKERERGGHIPIVALTAHALKEDEEKCLAAGMDAYIAKPIDFGKCLQVIGEMIKK